MTFIFEFTPFLIFLYYLSTIYNPLKSSFMKNFLSAAIAVSLFAVSVSHSCPVMASDTLRVHNTVLPVMFGRECNVVAEFCIESSAPGEKTLDGIRVTVDGLPYDAFRNVSLVYTGTMSALYSRTTSYVIKDAFYRMGASQRIYCDPGYAVLKSSARPVPGEVFSLPAGQKLVKGKNWFYVSVSVDEKYVDDISGGFSLEVEEVSVDGKPAVLMNEGSLEHRFGVAVRDHGDDGVWAYRIPGLVTTGDGTLISVYDVRHASTLDLQDNIDVGMSRSTDGGRTWEPMKVIMDMGRWGGLPDAQNGIGDPSVLVDENTGEIFVVAVWTHGLGNDRAWNQVGSGFEPHETAQLMIVSSKDDGKTWSEPRNITRDVKQESWRFTLQGPGRGITMSDGTLVFPIQYVDSTRVPNAGIMYSKDHGLTWHCHGHAWTNTTEAQAAEVAPGVLMLNMRNNRRTGRIVCTTEDLGRTWKVHPSSEKLREPVCMAGLLMVRADENSLGKDILLFSNPDTEKGRNHITIKASLDGGLTWLSENSVLLDEEEGWGYSCLTLIDEDTVGILYEGSTSQLVFQAVKLSDIID